MTFEQLRAFSAIVETGSFQSAAKTLHISQPAISAAIKKFEQEYGVTLFDRDSYRAKLTPEGEALLQKAKYLLKQSEDFQQYASILAKGEEPELSIAIVESAPFGILMEVLSNFFQSHMHTKLKINCEGVRGALDRLLHDQADIALTGGLGTEGYDLEIVEIGQIILVPVVAKNHPAALLGASATEQQLQQYVQVIIRDTSTSFKARDFGVVSGANSCTVNDQEKKKMIIMAGLGWGRLPHFMIQNELNEGCLVSLDSPDIRSVNLPLVAARKRQKHGPVAEKLWHYLIKSSEGSRLTAF